MLENFQNDAISPVNHSPRVVLYFFYFETIIFIHSESKSLPFIVWISGSVTLPMNKIDSRKKRKEMTYKFLKEKTNYFLHD